MKHILLKDLGSKTTLRSIEPGEVFAIHDYREKKSAFVLTPSTKPEEFISFGLLIKGKLFQSDWVSESQFQKKGRDAMKQVLFIKQAGWYNTGETMLDDELKMHRETKYRCAYCGAETTEPKGACVCRRVGKVLESKA